MKKEDIIALIAAIGICEGTGVLGAIFTTSAIPTWYTTLNRPPLTPPNVVFGPVWTTLFALMGIAAFLVWQQRTRKKKQVKRALTLFAIQLVLNFFWSIIFFSAHSLVGASIEVTLLLGTIIATIVAFAKISRPAAWLMVPYVLWVSFATYLTYAFWILN